MRTAERTPPGAAVVVGAGLAGLMTALDLAPAPCVVLTTAGLTEHTSSDLAQGGIAAALDPGDSPYLHALDTIQAGAGLCDADIVERVTAAAPDAVRRLAGLGVRFDRASDGTIALGLEGAHSRHRVAHAGGDATGHELLRAAVAAVRATPSVTVLEHTRALRLVVDDGRVIGVLVERRAPGRAPERSVLRTAHVVLATGGVGGLFRHTTNPVSSRGQGLGLAARAGAELRDLEMVQFHPTALDVGLDPMPLVSEAVRGAGAHLVTTGGARLADDDLAPRDVVARAVLAEVRRGGRALLDARDVPDFASHFPTVAAACREAGVDPAREPVPVRPAAHYHMGGVAVDARGRTTVPGLWAVGEVASTGLHGANRLASNSLLEAVVCAGWVAADVAADLAAGVPDGASPRGLSRSWTGPEAGDRLRHGSGATAAPSVPTGRAADDLRALVSDAVGVLRDGDRLARAVAGLRARVDGDPERADDDTLVALLLATSALRREESRGGHTRTDFPHPAAPDHVTLTLADALRGDLATIPGRSTAS